ncbi:hypothetical protein [Paludisphaera sp.]|uniref:hypothetical protein n=1 Tax=Paludisphaera sp. TaxID=2017432 RepID=UPI00301B87AA
MKTRRCCWPGCGAVVPASMWGCKAHWFRLPKSIRDRIWAAYRRGQEEDGSFSPRYAEAFKAAREFALKANAVEAQEQTQGTLPI